MKGLQKLAQRLWKGQRGITGLETAIVLIAFVVVSSTFAFAALSTGLFASDKSKDTIHAGLSEARGTLEVRGGVVANGTLTAVTGEAVGTGDGSTTAFTLANNPDVAGSQTVYVNAVAQTEGSDYTIVYDTGVVTFTTAPANGLAVTADYTYYSVDSIEFSLANAAGGQAINMSPGETVLTYQDTDTLASDISTFTVTPLGNADSDNQLEEGEIFQVSLTVSSYGLTDLDDFTIQVKPPAGAVVNITRSIPSNIKTVMELN